MATGSFCLVLHGHLPYVLRHGVWPHGEDWLYEAAAETYLPLLSMLGECRFLYGNPRVTIGLTPVLLEQLACDHFRQGFKHYLADRVDRARSDRKDFESRNDLHLAYLATRWEEFYTGLAQQFAEMDEDIPQAYAQHAKDGFIEILTSAATHAYFPLMIEDSSIVAQLRAGKHSSRRILGWEPKGLWLPECAYRPAGLWTPPVSWGGTRDRQGVERILAREGTDHFFVEHHLIEGAAPQWVRNGGDWRGGDEAWRQHTDVHEPLMCSSGFDGVQPVSAFGRDPFICEQVWSGSIGYPADGVYLEFHKRHGEKRGLRYWKVTNAKSDLGAKDPYYPDDLAGKIHQHAMHFCNEVRNRLRWYRDTTGREGVVTACFDAELFGHWWFEGPRFLRDVLLTLNSDPEIDLCTTQEYLDRHPPRVAASLPEGSWGEGGDHRVWANDRIAWMWEIEYRCEAIFGKLTYTLPWRKQARIRELLEKAARELLLLQASDWIFAVSRGQAVDYGIKRFMQHVARFESLADIAEKLASDLEYLGKLSEVEQFEIHDADLHDIIFPDIDLEWWSL